jgi:hypothetical protein
MLDLPYEYRPMISKQCLISWEGYTHNKGYLYNCLYTDSMYTYVYTVLKIYMYITYTYIICAKSGTHPIVKPMASTFTEAGIPNMS